MAVHRVRCAAATDNSASLRVISRLGFRFEASPGKADWSPRRWLITAIFARLSSYE